MDKVKKLQGIFDELLKHDNRPLDKRGVGRRPGRASRVKIKTVAVTTVEAFQTDPTDGWGLYDANHPLFSQISINDINQNALANCYFLAVLQSLANNDNGRNYIKKIIFIDPTDPKKVIVVFQRAGTVTRVHADLLVDYIQNKFDAADADLWVELLEKCYAFYRTGADTFQSLNYGNPSTVASDLGCTSPSFNAVSGNLYSQISNLLKANNIVCLDTVPQNPTLPNLVANHCYTVLSMDAQNNLTLRNPWGSAAPDQNRVVVPADFNTGSFNYMESAVVPVTAATVQDPRDILLQKIKSQLKAIEALL